MDKTAFEWDPRKNETNAAKHGISFFDAQRASEPRRAGRSWRHRNPWRLGQGENLARSLRQTTPRGRPIVTCERCRWRTGAAVKLWSLCVDLRNAANEPHGKNEARCRVRGIRDGNGNRLLHHIQEVWCHGMADFVRAVLGDHLKREVQSLFPTISIMISVLCGFIFLDSGQAKWFAESG